MFNHDQYLHSPQTVLLLSHHHVSHLFPASNGCRRLHLTLLQPPPGAFDHDRSLHGPQTIFLWHPASHLCPACNHCHLLHLIHHCYLHPLFLSFNLNSQHPPHLIHVGCCRHRALVSHCCHCRLPCLIYCRCHPLLYPCPPFNHRHSPHIIFHCCQLSCLCRAFNCCYIHPTSVYHHSHFNCSPRSQPPMRMLSHLPRMFLFFYLLHY